VAIDGGTMTKKKSDSKESDIKELPKIQIHGTGVITPMQGVGTITPPSEEDGGE
jgi:hypothetical protein